MKNRIVPFCLFLLLSTWLSAQAVVPEDVYRSVDSAMSEQGAPGLTRVLQNHAGSPWYPRLESYVIKRARQQVAANDLDQARAVSLALVDANLDNQEAVELYQSVSEAITKRDAQEKKQAEQDAIAAHKAQVADSKARAEAEKTFKAVTNPTTGRKIYLDQEFNTHYREISWDLMFGLMNLSYVMDSEREGLKYGLSGSAALIYRGEVFSAAADIMGDGMILALTGESGVNWSMGGVASFASNNLSKKLFLRLGYATFTWDSGSENFEETAFNTPLVGLGFRDIRMGETGHFHLALDWYGGHLMDDDITVAFGADMNITFELANMQDFSIFFRMGLKDTLVLHTDGMKNDIKAVLAIGVGNYE